VALLGRLKNDAEAPRQMIGPTPCDSCQSAMDSGITLIEADPETGERTGRWVVISEEAAVRIGAGVEQLIWFIEPEDFESLISNSEGEQE